MLDQLFCLSCHSEQELYNCWEKESKQTCMGRSAGKEVGDCLLSILVVQKNYLGSLLSASSCLRNLNGLGSDQW